MLWLLVDKYDKESGLFILRCMRDGVRDLLTSLLFLDSVKDTPSIIRVLDVKSTDRRALTSFEGFLKQSSIWICMIDNTILSLMANYFYFPSFWVVLSSVLW